jgi:phospholipid-binding lipoprotein MlaA
VSAPADATRRRLLGVLGLLAVCAALGCASPANRAAGDPLEPINRPIFWFNEQFDRWLLEPVATGYDFLAPDRVQKCVSNFFRNLRFPILFANNLLQGDVDQAYMEIGRFGVNSTVGLAGLFDPATELGLRARSEDFGQTLGVWGFGPGPYLVIPLLGPSNARDASGMAVDSFGAPGRYFLDAPIVLGARALQLVNLRARYLELIEENRVKAFDYYTFVRDAFLDLRAAQVRNGELKDTSEQEEDLYFLEEP